MTAYLEKYGQAVIDQGYDICFIRPGEKRPFGKDWEAKKHGPNRLKAALDNGRSKYGIGVKTKHTPLADIDCYDEAIVEHMREFIEERCGATIERTGMAPKLGMVYRSDKPFFKIQSKVFLDDEGRQNKLEILGDGQQFVALHIHPDTGKPYRWKDKKHVGNTPRTSLPPMDAEDATEFVAEFERQCRAKGWPEKSTVKRLQRSGDGEYDYDDPFITDTAKTEITPEELRAKLQMVPNADEHDTWFQIGMALYHQFDGSDEGLLLWHEWSSQAHNYDSDALDSRWTTFGIEGKKRQPLTARFILKLAKEEEDRLATDEFDEIKAALDEAEDTKAIRLVCERVKRTAFDSILRATVVNEVTAKLKAMGAPMTRNAVAAMVRFEDPNNHKAPAWLEHFVYCQQDETFYSTKTRQMLSTKAFDQSFNRFMMTKRDVLEGRSSPEHAASHVALNRYTIPFVANRMYLPGEGEIFKINGLDYVNSYSDISVPEVPEGMNRRGRRAVDRIIRHMEHLFPVERDWKLLLSWMAYIVQTNKRVSWAPVIQGTEGDGKTFFYQMMGCALGSGNVRTIPGDALGEQYTSWAENSQLCFIEEVRLHGKDRFAVINKIKPFITNGMVSVRRMRTDFYDVINTVNYMLTTNYKDGVPVNAGATRYFPIFSRWQSKQALAKFNRENPKYYDELHEALQEMGAIRKFLLDYELHEEFNPAKRAPASASLDEMIYLNQSEDEEIMAQILEESTDPLVSTALMDSANLSAAILDAGGAAPQGPSMKRLLSEHSFTAFPKPVKLDGKTRRLWSTTPERWIKDGEVDTAAIRMYLADGGDLI
jgi:hypothetical protein